MDDTSKSGLRMFDQFEPDVFWEQHSKKIITAALVIFGLGFVVFYWQRQVSEREQRAAASLAQAADVRSLEGIAQEYPKTEVAAQALLRLGDVHFQAGRYGEAGAAYQRFLNDYPRHALVQSALLGLAAIQEAQGSFEEARAQYTRIAASYPRGYAAWSARMGAARCLEASGQLKEAQQAYEEILPAGQRSPWQREAYLRWVVLSRDQKADSQSQLQSTQQNVPAPLNLAPAPQGQR